MIQSATHLTIATSSGPAWIKDARRLARYLWRMCFGLFIASGSFFLGQMKFLPQSLRILPLVGTLAVAPLVILLY